MQFIRLLAVMNTTLCFGAVLYYSRSGVFHLLFVVGMWEHPRGRAHTFILSWRVILVSEMTYNVLIVTLNPTHSLIRHVMFLDFVGTRETGNIVSTALNWVAKPITEIIAVFITPQPPVLCWTLFLSQPSIYPGLGLARGSACFAQWILGPPWLGSEHFRKNNLNLVLIFAIFL